MDIDRIKLLLGTVKKELIEEKSVNFVLVLEMLTHLINEYLPPDMIENIAPPIQPVEYILVEDFVRVYPFAKAASVRDYLRCAQSFDMPWLKIEGRNYYVKPKEAFEHFVQATQKPGTRLYKYKKKIQKILEQINMETYQDE